MFPTEAYRELCIKNQEVLREEWGPRVGDFCVSNLQGLVFLIGARRKYEAKYDLILLSGKTAIVRPGGQWDIRRLESIKQDFTPLFQPRQLIEMLGERGVLWRMGHIDPLYRDGWLEQGLISEEDRYFASKRPEIGDERRIVCYGPDPAIALLKCLLEVIKEE